MLIVPVDGRYVRGRVAGVTWLLVVCNVLIHLYAAPRTTRELLDAVEYYVESPLPELEWPHYRDWVARSNPGGLAAVDEAPGIQAPLMLGDAEFQRALDAEEILRPGTEGYASWRPERARFREVLDGVFSHRFAVRPNQLSVLSLVSYQFLHADFGHLIGNMVILALVGVLIEAAIGGWRYLVAYLLTGACAGAVHALVHAGSTEPLVGASGSIAGTMGLFAVVFAGRKVRFFYVLFAWVGMAMLPALLLLPYWIGWELLQWMLAHGDRVAYDAHAAGLVSGALLGAALRRIVPGEVAAVLDRPEQDEKFEEQLREGDKLVGSMQLDRARALYGRLHAQRPGDARPLEMLYTVARMAPGDPAYHAEVLRILSQPTGAPATKALVARVRDEYLAAGDIRLPPAQLVDLFEQCAFRSQSAHADRLLRPLLASKSQDPRIRRALLLLAGRVPPEKGRAYRALADRHYP